MATKQLSDKMAHALAAIIEAGPDGTSAYRTKASLGTFEALKRRGLICPVGSGGFMAFPHTSHWRALESARAALRGTA
jgi:hypothetical protein